MHELCEANGIRYFHFLQPNQYVPDSKRLGEEERETAFTADHPYRRGVEKGYPFLVQSGRELSRRGIRFHDLTMTFSDTDEQIYIDDCCHYNEKGNEILGAVIGQTIVEGMATE